MVDFAMDVHKSLYPDQEVPATILQSFSMSAETTVEQVNISTFIGFWFNQLT